MPQKALGSIVGLLCTGTCLVQGKDFCFGVNNEQYRCEMGYCCGETECCTYYYELWWFWLVWTLIIILMAYQGASSSFISPPPFNPRFWNDCKLPDYEEVVGHPPTQLDGSTAPEPPDETDSRLDIQIPLMAEEDEDEELITRRRHVTGDSGIEVCVCQLDVDEGSGLEEEDDHEHRICRVSGRDCCSGHQQQTLIQKEHTTEL
uniref:Uncharacterized protein n=1 Tax=Mola mola TaxID=94237 RepID=A0A3Q3WD83_MOLML